MNQKGERLRGFEVNTLTVIATESYEQFAENLQKDIEKDTGILFGVVQDHEFAGQRQGAVSTGLRQEWRVRAAAVAGGARLHTGRIAGAACRHGGHRGAPGLSPRSSSTTSTWQQLTIMN